MLAAVHAAYGPQRARCPDCREPTNRAQFGCDADARQTVYRTTCPACLGGGGECATCEGRKLVDYRRCPRSQSSPDADLCVQLWGRYKHGHLPYSGGWLDQPPILGEVFALVGSEYDVIEQLTRKA